MAFDGTDVVGDSNLRCSGFDSTEDAKSPLAARNPSGIYASSNVLDIRRTRWLNEDDVDPIRGRVGDEGEALDDDDGGLPSMFPESAILR